MTTSSIPPLRQNQEAWSQDTRQNEPFLGDTQYSTYRRYGDTLEGVPLQDETQPHVLASDVENSYGPKRNQTDWLGWLAALLILGGAMLLGLWALVHWGYLAWPPVLG